MITKLVLFLCLFCPVPDKERAILEDALSRCSSLERIGEIMAIAGSIQEWILRRNLHRPCMPQLMERSYTQEEREDMDTV